MAPTQAGYAPNLSAFLAYLRDKENNPIESCIEFLISCVNPPELDRILQFSANKSIDY